MKDESEGRSNRTKFGRFRAFVIEMVEKLKHAVDSVWVIVGQVENILDRVLVFGRLIRLIVLAGSCKYTRLFTDEAAVEAILLARNDGQIRVVTCAEKT